MYSRSFGTFEKVSDARAYAELMKRKTGVGVPAVPVQSFSDKSAYERFDRMEAELKQKNEPAQTENINVRAVPAQSEEEDAIENAAGTKTEPTEKVSALRSLFDGDWHKYVSADSLMLAAVALMMLLSDSETPDRLTPLVLLALVFL